MPPCKPSGLHRFRRWRHGSPGSGTPLDTALFHHSHIARPGQHPLHFCLAAPLQAMTPFSTYPLKWPICPASRCSRNRPAAHCGSCVNPTQPSSPIARDAWSFQGEWPTFARNLIAWLCKRRSILPIDDFLGARPKQPATAEIHNQAASPCTSNLDVNRELPVQGVSR